jgi:hypothetical protein
VKRSVPAAGTIILLLAAASALAAQPAPAARAARATTTPVIDGKLNDAAWAEAEILSGFVQKEPLEGRPVSERTEVRVLYDDDALYIAAWLFDAGDLVVGRAARDASLNDTDAFLLILDTYLDRQNGLVFGTTPAGIEYDAQVINEGQGGGFNLNWDANWRVATSRDAEGWYVEMRIPFSTLRYPKAGPQNWGLNFERRIRRKNEQAVWAPLPRQLEIQRVSRAGTLALEAPVRRVMTVSPYIMSDVFKDYRVAAPEARLDAQVGGDAKFGIGRSLILDLTVNTDFAQAEVDDQQVNLTRFSLFFPEKRPFFLENGGLFAVGASRSAELFFSRRIGLVRGQEVPIRGGARLTGRLAGLHVGALNIQTAGLVETAVATGERRVISAPSNFAVLRMYREAGNRTRIGAIATSRINTDSPSDRNLTFGVDGRLGIGQDLTLDAWGGMTSTRLTPGTIDTRTGFANGEYAFSGAGRYVTRDWQVSGEYRQVGTHFNPEVGFLNRSGYRHVNSRVLRHIRTPAVPWFREFRPHVSGSQFWNLNGFMQSYLVHIDNHFAFENGAFFQLPGFNLTGEGLERPFTIRPGIVIPAGTYHNADWEFRANTNRSAPLSASAGWDLGGFYSGTRFGPNASLTYRSGGRMSASLQGNWFDVRLAEGRFTTAVMRLNTAYSFTPNIFLQSTVQYNDDLQDLRANVRLSVLQRGGAGLFIVLNDAEHFGSLDRTGLVAGPRQRQLIVKYSRLLEFSR